MLGGWLAVLAGAWFVVGRALAAPFGIGDPGIPVAVTDAKRVSLELAYFSGLGAVIVFLGAIALGRLTIRSARDVEYAQRPVTPEPAQAVTTAQPPAKGAKEAAGSKPHRWGRIFGEGQTHAH